MIIDNKIGPEQAITICNWDKILTWEALAKQLRIKSWATIINEYRKDKE